MATPPPSPPSPPEGDATPDAGNPAGVTPPKVTPKPGRQSARKVAGAAKKPTTRARRSSAKTAAAPKPATPRKPAKPRAAARPRPRPAGRSVAAAPTDQPVDTIATDPASRSRGGWWKALAGGLGALAAGAALFTLRGSSRRKPPSGDDKSSRD
jgi:hypothetical protein